MSLCFRLVCLISQAILFLTPTSFPYAVPFCPHPLYIQSINFDQGSFTFKGEAGTRVQAHRQRGFLHLFMCMCVCVRWVYSSHNAWDSSTDFWTSATMATISPEALELLLAGWVPQEADSETEISTEEVYQGELLHHHQCYGREMGRRGLWWRVSGSLWRVKSVGLSCRVASHWGQGAEPLCSRGLPWDGCVTLLEVALFRRLGL